MVGTLLNYSTLDDQQNETIRIQKRMKTNKTLSQSNTRQNKNKTRKRTHQVNSMLEFMHKQDESDNQLDETFEMLKPELSRTTSDQQETTPPLSMNQLISNQNYDSDDEQPDFLRSQTRPMLDSSESKDKVIFTDPRKYAQLVKEYGEEMLKPWASPEGAGSVPPEIRRRQVQEGFTGYSGGSVPYHGDMSNDNLPRDAVMEKMNYMIHLLEDQKEQRTDTVNEELILYLFLGIFAIFITDTFTRVGRYRR